MKMDSAIWISGLGAAAVHQTTPAINTRTIATHFFMRQTYAFGTVCSQ
jgi:hypothetical protein